MCSLMYRLSMKPQYENWCNCCVVSLFSPWVTPGPSLRFLFCSVTLFFFFPSPSPLHSSMLNCSLSVYLLSLSPSPISCSLSFLLLSVPFVSPTNSPSFSALLPLSPAATEAWFTSTTGWRKGLLSTTSSGHMAPCRGWQQDRRTFSICYSP